ncbi:MAG: HepT-like ribonuclease domain-containing protein [Oceanicaulis sp.]
MKPEKDWRVYVYDMATYARHARSHVAGYDRARFDGDLKTIHAVTRCIEIVGEAANRVPEDVKARAPGVPWRRIIATRNVVAHAYGDVSLDVIWSLVSDGLLEDLEHEMRALLDAPPR